MSFLIKSILPFLMGLSLISYAAPMPGIIEVTGIMRCVPAVNSAPDFYDMYGCNSSSGVLTIQKFFDRYKRDTTLRIIKIHYDSYQNLLHIYYGKDPIFPYPHEFLE